MWEIETSTVGNGSDQGEVSPGQPGYVGSPPTNQRGPDKTDLHLSTELGAIVGPGPQIGELDHPRCPMDADRGVSD
jgi:hypothetical protein